MRRISAMNPGPRMRLDASALAAIAVVVLMPVVASADAYTDARASLVAAYEAADYKAMRGAAQEALVARPGYPGALFNLALAQLLDGDTDASLGTLERLLAMRIDFGIADVEDFAPLQEHPGWQRYADAVAKLNAPVGAAAVAFTLDEPQFIPEGIALDSRGRLYLGSIRDGRIVRVGDTPETLVSPGIGGHWSVFGMRIQNDEGLWFASASTPQFAGPRDRSAYKTGLFFLDAESGEVTRQARLPVSGEQQVLGDLVIVDGDTIIATDQADGVVYRYSIPDDKYTVLVDRGTFVSPQGLVLDATGEHLYVADYVGGLFRVALDTGAVQRVSTPDAVSDYGIDGLYRHGRQLVAIQNGIRPHRVVSLSLSDDGLAVNHAGILAMNLPEFDEPNLGVVAGDSFLFIANSHWNRFDRDNRLPEDLAGPVILEISLSD